MKVAVSFTGLGRDKIHQCIKSHHYHFSDADFFFGTWKGYESTLPFTPTFTFDEPTIDYHPMVDNEYKFPEPYNTKFLSEGSVKNFRKLGHENPNPGYERTKGATKQILGHINAVETLPKEYDVIIRARYDVILSPNVNFQPLIERAHKEKVTFGFGVWHVPREDYKFNDFLFCEERYLPLLLDWLIIHPRASLKIDEVKSLHENKQLYPSEWGWFQALGPNRINIGGAACIAREPILSRWTRR